MSCEVPESGHTVQKVWELVVCVVCHSCRAIGTLIDVRSKFGPSSVFAYVWVVEMSDGMSARVGSRASFRIGCRRCETQMAKVSIRFEVQGSDDFSVVLEDDSDDANGPPTPSAVRIRQQTSPHRRTKVLRQQAASSSARSSKSR